MQATVVEVGKVDEVEERTAAMVRTAVAAVEGVVQDLISRR